MKYNYYCNGEGFDEYEDAVFYSEVLLAQFRIYRVVFTRDEIQAQTEAIYGEL
jgi:hypothetical protein